MKELKEIVRAYDATLGQGRRMALASVVHVDGSSYRRAGARMLVDDEGNMTGAISGGCLEGDALRKAQLVIAQQDPKLVVYDTSDEDDMSIGVQLGCAGVIHVLFEPITEKRDPVKLFRMLLETRQKAVLLTLYNTDRTQEQYGTLALMKEDGGVVGEVPEEIRDRVMKDMREVMTSQQSSYLQYELCKSGLLQSPLLQSVTAFIEFMPPPVSLVVIGAGNDAIPLVNIGSELGWDVRVVDGRGTHAKPERFVGACQVLVSKPEVVLDQIRIDERTMFVLMTHNYNYDLAMLKELMTRDVSYIGVLGPKKKLDRMINEIREKGIEVTEEMLGKIYGPVGLDIGAETSEEIALSIIAEIKAVIHQKPGTSLRFKKGTIHTIENI